MTEPTVYRLAVVSGGTSDPSSTRMLADRITARIDEQAGRAGARLRAEVIDLRALATEVTTAITSGLLGPGLTRAVEVLAAADGLVVSTPVYKAGASGLFTSFFQVLDDDLLIGKPVVLAATAGSARHALVIDDQLRALFAYLRTLPVPTSVFAASEDWNSTQLGSHIDRAAVEVLLLMQSEFSRKIKNESWHNYQHSFGSAGGTELDIDLNTDLMRLATGGSAGSRS